MALTENAYAFLLDAYETETLKTAGIWAAFADDAMNFRPAEKSRTVLEQMDHQIQSEGGWMVKMLGIDIGDFQPKEKTKRGYIAQYTADAAKRLALLRAKPESWWREPAAFFDVQRSRAASTIPRIIAASSSSICDCSALACRPSTAPPPTPAAT